jgi:hypothetical protein
MKLRTVVVLTAVVAGGVGLSAPAFAATFADYSATSSFDNIQWTAAAGGLGGALTAVGASPNADLSFLGVSTLSNLSTTFVYHGTSSAAAVSSGGYIIQPDLAGRFKFVYGGPAFAYNGHTYSSGDVLLSGSFTGADIVGRAGSSAGNVNDATLAGGTITFHSPLVSFGSGQRSYSIEMTSIASPLGVTGSQLNSFGAVSTGSFEAAIGGGGNQGVPEPASWALILIGVGAIGGALRRRGCPAPTAG